MVLGTDAKKPLGVAKLSNRKMELATPIAQVLFSPLATVAPGPKAVLFCAPVPTTAWAPSAIDCVAPVLTLEPVPIEIELLPRPTLLGPIDIELDPVALACSPMATLCNWLIESNPIAIELVPAD